MGLPKAWTGTGMLTSTKGSLSGVVTERRRRGCLVAQTQEMQKRERGSLWTWGRGLRGWSSGHLFLQPGPSPFLLFFLAPRISSPSPPFIPLRLQSFLERNRERHKTKINRTEGGSGRSIPELKITGSAG